MSIQERQNRPEAIALLAAQRFLYRRAKLARNAGLVLVIIVGIIGLIASVSANQYSSQWIPTLVLLLWLFDQQVLRKKERASRTEAAVIQERFDCEVLDLPWPSYRGIQPPTNDRVRQLEMTARADGGQRGLRDWYPPESIPSDPNRAKIRCQRLNCWWDVNLRRKWRTCVAAILWGFGVLLLLLSVLTGMTVAKFVVVLASNIRVLAWGLGELQDQADAIQRVEGIHTFLSRFNSDQRPLPADIRNVQDAILDHRHSSRLVPDWFYARHRDNQEREARGDPDEDTVSRDLS